MNNYIFKNRLVHLNHIFIDDMTLDLDSINNGLDISGLNLDKHTVKAKIQYKNFSFCLNYKFTGTGCKLSDMGLKRMPITKLTSILYD